MRRFPLSYSVAGFMLLAISAFTLWPFSDDQSASQTSADTPARNVILFIGDGMGVSTVTAARIYDGQSRGQMGEENLLSFEHFPYLALVKTYNTNQQVPDSAGTASAMNSGVKTRAGLINIGPDAKRGVCRDAQNSALPVISGQVLAAGKSVGLVSTTRLTHATPAAVFAHSADRNWESDRDIPSAQRDQGCRDIAAQLVDFPFSVALGGGAAVFRGADWGGRRLDAHADLVAQWQSQSGGTFIDRAEALTGIAERPLPVLGLFAPSHLSYQLTRSADSDEPTLSAMTAAALSVLEKNPEGYFLMVEGGRIDHGHHAARPDLALSETQEFARAVQTALDRVDMSDTLVLVTADHSHVFTMAGYPARGNPILGLVRGVDGAGEPTGEPVLAMDGKPYTTLGYQNGPGATINATRATPDDDPHGVKQGLVPTGSIFDSGASLSETHGGEDVALYAIGNGAARVHGVIEQNYIHDIIATAFGMSH